MKRVRLLGKDDVWPVLALMALTSAGGVAKLLTNK